MTKEEILKEFMLSDEEIEKYALQEILESDSIDSFEKMQCWISGVKWLRDKLKENA